MKKTVIEIMDYAAAYRGNFLSSILSLSDELKKQDVETVLVFPERTRERDWARELSDEGRTVIFLPNSFCEAVRVLRSLFAKYNVMAVHSHFINSRMYLPLKTVNFFKRVPHYFHAHSTAKQKKKDIRAVIRRFLLAADKIICVGDSVAKSYEALGFRNCITVKNSIFFSRLDGYTPLKKEMISSNGKHCVLMFGYDFYIKGIDTAIEALDKYDKDHDITLCICVASHMDKAEEYIKDRFKEIPDWIKLLPPRDDVASYMKSADVFLSASRTEGMAYAVLEVAYCETPLVLSDIGPHKELGLPSVNMFSVENEAQLYGKLTEALTAEKTDVNKRFVQEEFSMDIWLKKMIELLCR